MRHPTLLDMIKARKVLADFLQPTPLHPSPGFSELLGVDMLIKYENHQPIGSFKIRGGIYTMTLLTEDQRRHGVVTASTGNHGQGVAYGGQALDIPVSVVVPHGTPDVKSRAIQLRGAQLHVHGDTISDGFKHAARMAREDGMVYIEDGEDFGLMAGAGTLGLEIIDAAPDLDIVLVPVGGGNLIAGMSVAIKAINPCVKIIGVQAEQAPSVLLSWQQGIRVTTDTCDTFAGGLATTFPGGLAFDVLRDKVDEMHLVTEHEMMSAISVVFEQTGYVAEGAAAAVFAMCLKESHNWSGLRVVALFSGGNLGTDSLRQIMG